MKKLLTLTGLLIGLTIITSCKKEDKEPEKTTSLEISIKDELGNAVSGASVKLYSSDSDWKNGTDQVGSTQYSDASGTVKFDNLSNIRYYWFAEKDCKNNFNGSNTTTTPLTSKTNNTVNSIIYGTGTLKFVSTSSNPYRIYINGSAVFDMNGGATEIRTYMPAASYSLRVLQLSGYLIYPTDQTYTGVLGCGQTLTTTFP